jgi:RimJ/RimL family protein N-acetyltransferase
MTRLRIVDTYAELVHLSGDDPYLRFAVPDPLPTTALAGPGAVAVERHGWRHGFVVIPLPGGDADAVEGVLLALRDEGHVADRGVSSLSVPQWCGHLLPQHFTIDGGGDWEWLWTTVPPRHVPGEDDLRELDDAVDAAEIRQLSEAHSPRGEGDPGAGTTELWLGLRDADGALIAVGGMQRLASGAPHLAGIVVATPHRGRGLGLAVTAALTRRALDDSGVCTLGMYSDNAAARNLYHRLGYRTAYAWTSRRLLRTCL